MSRIYDNWERLVGAALKRERFREMALAPPSRESSFSSRQSDLSSFASSSRHDELGVGNSATGATPGGVAARAALLFAAPLAYYRRRKQQDHSFDFRDEVYLGQLKRFSLRELEVATDNFSDKNSIGRGGYGKVYKGRLADGTLVAVKRLRQERTQDGETQFQTEVEMISMAVHRNLQRLHGFCITPTERLLVYPYMTNGSVASWLRERPEFQPPLDWPKRKRIAVGSAAGQHFYQSKHTFNEMLRSYSENPKKMRLHRTIVKSLVQFFPLVLAKHVLARTFRVVDGFPFPPYGSTTPTNRETYSKLIYDNWERLVGEVPKRERFLQMALAPPSRESSFSSRQSDLTSFASSNRHDELGDGNSATGATIGNSATGATIGGVAARAALLFAAPLAYYRRRKQQDPSFDFGAGVYLGHLERFSLLELQVASDNFSHKNSIGRGGYGKVYKGRLADGTLVAVKRLKEERTQDGERQFQMEVETISMAVHRNLQRLHGFCMTPTERLLVYPYMANGSVASWLRERPESQPPLDWPIRKRIAAGSARGLAYLHEHCDQKIIHRDIKVANILLDEDFEAVVGDFGLAKLIDHKDTHVTTVVCGTIGHIAPEYLYTRKISEKTDVYGYGVMILELITGQRAVDHSRLANGDDIVLLDWVKGLMGKKKMETLVDADLKGNYIDEEVEQLIQVALLCTQRSPNERPKMSDVVGMLKGDGLAERWDKWQKEKMLLKVSVLRIY